ncbi:PepSY-associated TM helix domain-containing protein [Pedobacter jeongneungensis]|uniref:PepSY-associated TM helix domain-containing protein n=1 Tax=Pedobacter jeongneungensis TaxID=947309 RepID=UPI00046A7D64|nr:PepSY-associated TM helix domain-containing protein [Pedobacter jeongneungensis]
MDNRKYNIYFHTHTISGIIICALLYVIFFAGSFSFFKEEITAWQKNTSYVKSRKTVTRDFDHVIDSLSKKNNLKGRDFDFFIQRNEIGAYVSVTASNDTTLKKKIKPKTKEGSKKRGGRGRGGDDDSMYFNYDFAQHKTADYQQGYDMGEFLYRLHFLAQLNVVPIRLGAPFGYLLAGVVSFIFLFALLTGLMLHWDKIVSNFFTFRPWAKWKTLWTDLHTAIGVIGFPFQLIFAVTGVVLIANIILIAPFSKYLYRGDSVALYQDLEYSDTTKYAYTYQPLKSSFSVNDFMDKEGRKWPQSKITAVAIKNYGDSNMHVILTAKPLSNESFSGTGKMVYRVRDHKVLSELAPSGSSSYVDKVKSLIYHLHFGDFGGRPLRIIFFILGIMGCLVIISGILIWLVARDKKNVPKHKRVFNFWTANIFMASSLSMLPVTALTMISLLFIEKPNQSDIYHVYFYSWLILSVYFIARKNLTITNHQTLILSAVLCFLLPLADGFKRNNWLWTTFAEGRYDILFIDLLFLILAMLSIVVLIKMKQHDKLKPSTQPIKEVVENL